MFSAVSGGSATTGVPITVNASSFGLPFQVSTVTAAGGNWLQTDASSGTSPFTVNISANPVGRPAATYQGTVRVTSPYANPTTVNIGVTFTLRAASSGKLLVDSKSLAFTATEGAAPSTTQLPPQRGQRQHWICRGQLHRERRFLAFHFVVNRHCGGWFRGGGDGHRYSRRFAGGSLFREVLP